MRQRMLGLFFQLMKTVSSALELALFIVSYHAVREPGNISFLVGVLISSFSMALAKEIDLVENGEFYPRPNRLPHLHVFTWVAAVAQGVLLVADLSLLALLGSAPEALLSHVQVVCFILAMFALPVPLTELAKLVWSAIVAMADVAGRRKAEGLEAVPGGEARPSDPAEHDSPARKRDESAYGQLWGRVILPVCLDMVRSEPGLRLRKDAKQRVWEHYRALNVHVSRYYMRNPDGLLDRHKVAACYSYAVLQASPLWIDEETIRAGSRASTANERLAMVTACSIVATELRKAVEEISGISEDERSESLQKLSEHGLSFPEHVGHGSYVESVIACLRHTRREETYNVLAYALIIFHWERCTLSENVHHEVLDYYRKMREARVGPPGEQV